MRRQAVRRRAGPEGPGARDPLRRNARASSRPGASLAPGDELLDGDRLDAQLDPQNDEQLDDRLDERLDGQLDDRLDGQLDGQLDDRLDAQSDAPVDSRLDGSDAQNWPRYVRPPAPYHGLPELEAAQPTVDGEESRKGRKALHDRPTANAEVLVMPEMRITAPAPLAPPPASAPQAVPKITPPPAPLEKSEAKQDATTGKNAATKEDPKNAKDAAKDQGKKAGKGAAGKGKAANKKSAEGAQEEEEDQTVEPDPLPPDESTALEVPLEIEVPTLEAEWDAPASMGPDAIPEKPRTSATGEQKAKDGKPEEKSKAAADAAAHAGARNKALRAYSELADAARNRQQSFLGEVGSVSNYMAHAYGMTANEITHAHDAATQSIDTEAERRCTTIESNTTTAQLELQAAYDSGLRSLRGAAGSARGTIDANDKATQGLITSNVSSLKENHQGALKKEIDAHDDSVKEAVKSLRSWSDNRTTVYPLNTVSALEGAKNEAFHPRVQVLAVDKIGEIEAAGKKQIEAWTKTSDNSLCTVGCSYEFALNKARTGTFEGARTGVAKAFQAAKKGLAKQLEQGMLNIQRMRQVALTQVRNQQRSSRNTLTSQARATLSGARRAAQGAIGGIHGSARGTLPGYWRALGGFEQSMKLAAPSGAQALTKAAQSAGTPILRGLDNTSATLRTRLGESQQKLGSDHRDQQATLLEQRGQHLVAANAALAKPPENFAQQAADALARFNENTTQLASSVYEAAQSCAKAPEKLFEKSFGDSRTNAQTSLNAIFKTPGEVEKKDETPVTKDGDKGPKPDCTDCKKDGGGTGTDTGTGGKNKGITTQREEQQTLLEAFGRPKTYPEFVTAFDKKGGEVAGKVKTADDLATKALHAGHIDKVAEEKVTGALRGLTAARGKAVDQRDYPGAPAPTLSADLLEAMGEKDKSYKAAIHYLNGETKDGAKEELDDSQGFWNDQEERIDETMRALSPADAAAIGEDKELYERIHGALDGTDAKVFQALAKAEDREKGGAAEADALRMREKVDKAKLEGDHDAVHKAEKEFTQLRGNDWNARQLEDMKPEDRKAAEDAHRLQVAAALGKIVTEEDPAKKAAVADKTLEEKRTAYTNAAVDFVTRDVNIVFGEGGDVYEAKNAKPGDPYTHTIKMEGANRDLAAALLLNGKDSAEARSAAIGVELQRKDDGKAGNIDEAVYDDRFIRLLDKKEDVEKLGPKEKQARDAELAAARELRAKTLLMASEKYAGGKAPPKDYKTDGTKSLETDPDPHVRDAQNKLVAALGDKFKDDQVGKQFVTNLIKEERPSAKTASLAMRYAMYSNTGTDEELMKRYPARMTRDEIKAMKDQFRTDTGKDFEEEAGLYGKGSFAELSGDDALEMERAMLGVARTEQEKAEAAAFAMYQQQRETGDFGKWLAKGSHGEDVLNRTQAGLFESMGVGEKDFNPDGTLKPEAASRCFTSKGEYKGPNRDQFMANVMTGQLAAESYQAAIDNYANLATTGIAILGAIAAAVITVVTGGAAAPLIAAAVVTGLASMAANYAIKGGRYGWEQAAIDLGMTAVQAVTAGVGAGLGKAAQIAGKAAQAANTASKTLLTLAKLFTGNPVVDQIIIGAVTGSIGGLAGAAFDEKTWEKGGGDAVGKLFGGLIKGGLSGAATAAFTQSLEALGRNGAAIADKAKAIAAQGGLLRGAVGIGGRGLGAIGNALGKGLNASTGGGVGKSLLAMGQRGLARSAISGISAMAGRSTELVFDKATGRFHGRLEDALSDIGSAGLHAAIQGFGEGAGEAFGQGIHNQKVAAVAKSINDERLANNKPPFEGHPHDPNTPLGKAAEDLMFLNQHGKNGGDPLGRALNMEHIITHGGLEHTVATPHPSAAESDAMRAELLRHVPESLHGDFADVPIRVLSEGEYKALTRSESGPVVTLIENGKPVVVIRAGAELSHLANEGPHLLQTADAATRPKVAKLDESVLVHWDKLDVDTQVDLYKNKIELEIDAHQRIAEALEAKVARGDGDPARLAIDQARNEITLANLKARHEEVGNITPSQRKAMQNGEMPRPQYLEQPARLFSKGKKYDGLGKYTEQDAFGDEAEARRSPAEDADDDHPTVPDTPPRGRPEDGPGGRMFPPSPDEIAAGMRLAEIGNEFNVADNNRLEHGGDKVNAETYLQSESTGKKPKRQFVDATVEGKFIMERKHTQLAEIGVVAAIDYINQLVDIYRPGRTIGHSEKNIKAGIAGKKLSGEMILRVPEQLGEVPHKVLQHAADSNVTIQDPSGRRYTLEHPGGDDGVKRASLEPEVHANEMREHLMRHVDAATAAALDDVPISVLRPGEYDQMTGAGVKGPVVTLIKNGKPFVAIREGTPIHRLSDEGPHLRQTIDESTSAKVAKLEESKLANWHKLDVDEQLDLYKTKIELEIDAHEQIRKSLEAELPNADDIKKVLLDIDRNERTLGNLNRRRREVERITPEERAAMRSGAQKRKKYLEHRPRLFSKDPSGEIVFEPFVGPQLKSPKELQERYPGARVIAAEQSEGRIPSAKDVAEFEAGGGRFIADRFGETLPDNSVDRMHVRYPLPHEKAQETMLSTEGRSFAEIIAAAKAHQAAVESITNLAPHALRTLRPDGEIEIVFHENSIESEIGRACQREWTDPATGRRYRLEQVGEPRAVPRNEIAPHSGHGIPQNVTEVQVVTLRKVLLPEVGEPGGLPPGESTRSRAPSDERESSQARSLPRPIEETAAPQVHAPLAGQPQSESALPVPQAERELTPGEKKRMERTAKAVAEVPDMLRKLGIDPLLLDGATPGDMLNFFNALDGDPLASAGGKTKPEKTDDSAGWVPSEHQTSVARWALEGANGSPGEFHSRYEFARARFSALKTVEEAALKGTPDYRNVAAVNAGKKLTREFLTVELARDEAAVRMRADGQNLTGPTRGLTPIAVAQAVQELERLGFKSPAAEAYHAWKHRREVPSTVLPGGSVIERYFAGAMDTVKNGHVVFAETETPPKTGTRVVIHQRYVDDSGKEAVKEAIIHVAPDGTVTLSSWGNPKAVK